MMRRRIIARTAGVITPKNAGIKSQGRGNANDTNAMLAERGRQGTLSNLMSYYDEPPPNRLPTEVPLIPRVSF